MSLQPAVQEVSSHPTRGGVVDPTDRNKMNADVDRKLRLFGVVQAFRAGRMPTNTQILESLDYVRAQLPTNKSQSDTASSLSPEGLKLIQDLRDIIKSTSQLLEDKNADELLQNFVWHTRGVDTNRLKEGAKGELDANANVAPSRDDREQAATHLRTLLTLIISNAEVRKLLSDISIIGRDLLSIGASKAASTIAPPQSTLERVDETAPRDTFYTEGGRQAGLDETPVVDTELPRVGGIGGGRIRMDPKRDDQPILHTEGGDQHPLGTRAREAVGAYRDARESAPQRIGEAVQQSQQGEGGSGMRDVAGSAMDSGRRVAQEGEREAQDYANAEPQEKEAKKGGMMQKIREMKENVQSAFTDRVPEEQRDQLDEGRERANERVDRTKRFFTEEYFPEERRDQFVFRLKKVVLECQNHSDYQQSMGWLLDYADHYVEQGKNVQKNLEQGGQRLNAGSRSNDNLQLAMLELRTLLERFANGLSMDVMFDAVQALIDDSKRDPELRQWFSSVRGYVRKVLLEPGYIMQPASDEQARRLRDSGKQFYDGKYQKEFDGLFESMTKWFGAMGEDPLNQQFGNSWSRLARDLLFDSEGSLKFKPELWNDLRKVILPSLIQHMGYFPIPRIEYTDDSLDLVVENLTLQTRNILPNIVEMEVQNYLKFSPYDAITDDSHHKITFNLSQIQADMRDVAFYYRKKTGLPRMSDSGLADVLLGGAGLSAHVTLVSRPKADRSSIFKVHQVNVHVEGLKFSIRDSKHDFLYKTLKPLATGLIKRQIQKAVRDAISTALEYVDGRLVDVRQRMESAKEAEGQTRAGVLQDIFSRSKSAGSEATNAVSIKSNAVSGHAGEGRFKIISDKRESMLGDVGTSSGWVNKSAEKDLQAKTGQEWRSEAFTIAKN